MKHLTALLLLSFVSPGCGTGTPGETTDVWDELCEASSIEPVTECGPAGYCWTEAVIPMDLYCAHFECSPDIDAFAEQIPVCSPTRPEDFTQCVWEKQTGCGTIQFVERSDESSSFHIAFDEATGAVLGFTHSSDSSMNVCGADFLRVGTFQDYFWKPETLCADVQTSHCCDP